MLGYTFQNILVQRETWLWIQIQIQSLLIRPSLLALQTRLGGLPDLKTFTWQNLTRLGGLTGLADNLSCKRDHIKMRDGLYGQAGVTPTKRVTLPTQGSPSPCKQALTRTSRCNRFTYFQHTVALCLISKTDCQVGHWLAMHSTISQHTAIIH